MKNNKILNKKSEYADLNCPICEGTGKFSNPFDQEFICTCVDRNKALERKKNQQAQKVDFEKSCKQYAKYGYNQGIDKAIEIIGVYAKHPGTLIYRLVKEKIK